MKALQLTTLAIITSISLPALASPPYRTHHNNVPPLETSATDSTMAQAEHRSIRSAKPEVGKEALTKTYRKHHNNVVSHDQYSSETAADLEKLPAPAAGNAPVTDR